MNVKEIATKLAEYCKNGDYIAAQKELYANDAVSIEPDDSAGPDKETKGLEAINKKMEHFLSGVEESYGNTISEPVIANNSFSFKFNMDIKMKGQERMTMSELAVYTVKDGKIIQEQFFW